MRGLGIGLGRAAAPTNVASLAQPSTAPEPVDPYVVILPFDGQSLMFGSRGSYGITSLPTGTLATPVDYANSTVPMKQLAITAGNANGNPPTAEYTARDLIYARVGESATDAGGSIDTTTLPWAERSIQSLPDTTGEGGLSSIAGVAMAIDNGDMFTGATEVLFVKTATDGTQSSFHNMLLGEAPAKNRRRMWANALASYVRTQIDAGRKVYMPLWDIEQGERNAQVYRNADDPNDATHSDLAAVIALQEQWADDWRTNHAIMEEVFGTRPLTFVHDLVVMEGYTADGDPNSTGTIGSLRNTTGFAHPDPHTKWARALAEAACRWTVPVNWNANATLPSSMAATTYTGLGTPVDNGTAGEQRSDWHWLRADFPTRAGVNTDPHIHAACNIVRGKAVAERFVDVTSNDLSAYEVTRVAPYALIPGAASDVTASTANVTVRASWACQIKVLALPAATAAPTAAAILAHADTKTFTVAEDATETKLLTGLPSGTALKLWRVLHDPVYNFTGPVQPALEITTAAETLAKWNEDFNTETNVDYSVDSLTVTRNDTSGTEGVLMQGVKTSGKWYTAFEVLVNQPNFIGLVTEDFTTIGAGTGSERRAGLLPTGVMVTPNPAGDEISTAGVGIPSAGAIVEVAEDKGNDLLWMRVNGGDWNANASADPATGVGGQATVPETGDPALSYLGAILGLTLNSGLRILESGDTGYSLPSAYSARTA